MPNDLTSAYQRELEAIRDLAAQFADDHPKIAQRLRLTRDTVDDPHVERLLEGVAFLSARTQQRLDDEYPELTDALLNILYPHYLAPVPSSSVAQFFCMPDAKTPLPVASGSELQTGALDDVRCRFRTTMPIEVWPIRAHDARLMGTPIDAPTHPASHLATSCLRVTLSLTDPQARFDEIAPSRLRFFIHGAPAQAIQLYELLCQHTIGVALADGPNDVRPTLLTPSQLQPAGFSPEEALLPWPERSFVGFRLLTEYFALPEKFLFIDIDGLDARTVVSDKNKIDLFIYFDRSFPELQRNLRPDALKLGCAPIVNLFPGQCEPLRLTHTQTDYPIDADLAHPEAYEIWQVQSVREIEPDGSTRPWRPLYQELAHDAGDSAGVYTLIRRASEFVAQGTETRLAPIDLQLDAPENADRLLSIDALLTNGALPSRLPFGGSSQSLQPTEGLGSVTAIDCLLPPTQSWRADLRLRNNWRLISHLTLGRLSLVGGPQAAASLREILSLYDMRRSEQTAVAISSLVSVDARDAIARPPGGKLGSFCRGLDVTLTFEASRWAEDGLFLLASVIERFLALHVTVNTFVRTTVRLTGRPDPVARFPARAGYRTLL